MNGDSPVAVLAVPAAVAVARSRALAATRRAVVGARVALAGPRSARAVAAVVRLRLHAVQRVLQRRYQDLTTFVMGHLFLFHIKAIYKI